MGVNSLPKTVTRQCHGCDLNPGPAAPESSTLTARLPSHRSSGISVEYLWNIWWNILWNYSRTLLTAASSILARSDAIAVRVLAFDSFLSRTSAASVDFISDSSSLQIRNKGKGSPYSIAERRVPQLQGRPYSILAALCKQKFCGP